MSDIIFRKRYKIIKQIGEGGMAKVYLANDLYLKRNIALKVLKPETLSDAASMERFKKEITASTNLVHENIVQVYDVDFHDGKWFIAMEYIEGRTLKEVLNEDGALIPREAINVASQLCSAIKTAHNMGIIHRDIKPQNIVLQADGSVKLMDFGIAVIINTATVTKTNSIVGSVQYIAPEIVRGQKPSFSSDIYSMGILLYEMLRGSLPFTGESPIDIALKHISKPIPSLRKYNSLIPQALENTVIRATAKNPRNRYANAIAMKSSIDTAFDENRVNEKLLILSESMGSENSSKVQRKMGVKRGIYIPVWVPIVLAVAIGTFIILRLVS